MKLSCAPLWKLQVIVKTYKEKNVNENIIERQTSVTETQGLILGNDKFKKNKYHGPFLFQIEMHGCVEKLGTCLFWVDHAKPFHVANLIFFC